VAGAGRVILETVVPVPECGEISAGSTTKYSERERERERERESPTDG
jgi:hypothetical protein